MPSLVYYIFCWPYRTLNLAYRARPLASDVLTAYIRKREYPSWTSYFIAYGEIQDDHFGEKHFNFEVDGRNYHILRTGCYPYIKYHCTQRPPQDLSIDNRLYKLITVANFGIPCLLYGIAAIGLIRHFDYIVEPKTRFAKMMGPIDPMMYSPTWQLIFVMVMVFACIYGCGRAVGYVLWQILRCMKYLLLAFIGLYFYDDYEEPPPFDRDVRRRKAGSIISIRRERNEAPRPAPSEPTIVTSNGTSTHTTNVTSATTSLKEFAVDIDDNSVEDNESLHDSPTDDEDEIKSKKSSSNSPKLRHRKISHISDEPSPVIPLTATS